MHPNLLDQLHVFRTIADEGTFSAAAVKLNKTVSTISYTIANLEGQLQVKLFDRSQYRPTLTEFGQEINNDADQLLRRVDRFESRVGLHRENHKTNLVLSVDTIFPTIVLVRALQVFSCDFPMMTVNVVRRDYDGVAEDVKSGFADLGMARVDARLDIRDIDGMQIGTTQNLIVVSPQHPLAQMPEPFELSELENHRQIILSRSLDMSGVYQYRVHRTDAWTVPDDETLRALVKANVGWAAVNRHVVWQDLKDGSLVSPQCSSVRESTMNRLAVLWLVNSPNTGPRLHLCNMLRDAFPSAYPEEYFKTFNQWDGL